MQPDDLPAAPSFPYLERIDRACGPDHLSFASDPDAALLEQRARELADRYLSEFAWLTGNVPFATFARIRLALETCRHPRPDAVTVVVFPHDAPVSVARTPRPSANE